MGVSTSATTPMWISVAVMPMSVAAGGSPAVVGAAAALVAAPPVVAADAVVALELESSRPPHAAASSATIAADASNLVRFIASPRCLAKSLAD